MKELTRDRVVPIISASVPAVVSKNETVPVTNIDSKRQLFEQPRGQFEGLFRLTQTDGGASYVCDHHERRSHGFAPEGMWYVGICVCHLPQSPPIASHKQTSTNCTARLRRAPHCGNSHRRRANHYSTTKLRVMFRGIDILWADGETEVIKGFITEHDAVKWIAEYSKAWQRITDDKPSETP
jgi:hypothetical protein